MRLIGLLAIVEGLKYAPNSNNVTTGIPQFLWDMSPPSIFCSNSLLEGFETSLGLSKGYTADLANALDVSFVFALVELVTLKAGRSAPTSELWSDIEVLTYRQYIESMYKAMDELPEEHQFDPDGPFLPVWNLMQVEWLMQAIVKELPKHSNLVVSTIAKNFGLMYNNDNILNSTVSDLLNGINTDLADLMQNRRLLQTTEDEDDDGSCDLYARAENESTTTTTRTPGLTDEHIWSSFWNSALMTTLLSNLVSSIELTLNHLKIYASLTNAGDTMCRAVDASFTRDTLKADRLTCVMISLVGWLAGCGEQSPQCDLHRIGQLPVPRSVCTKNGPVIDPSDPDAIVDLNITHAPAEDPELLVNRNDGRVAYWLWRATQYVAGWSSKAYLCNWDNEKPMQVVPGWDTIAEWRSMQSDADLLIATNHSEAPFVFISKKRDTGCDYLITVRGTIDNFEWVQDWAAAQINVPGYNSDIHRGAFTTVNVMIPLITNTLEQMQKANCPDQRMRVIVTGHSLGGATAELIALLLGSRYGPEQMQLEVVSFGAVNSLSPDGAEDLLGVANVTSWAGELDGVPKLPCATSHFGSPRCKAVETFGNWGSGRDMYDEHPNMIMIPVSAFQGHEPSQMSSNVWGDFKFDLLQMKLEEARLEIAAPLQLAGWHICAYSCFLSRNFCVEEEKSAWQCDPKLCPLI